MTTIVLSPPADFINANQRLHHHARAKLTRAWRRAAMEAVPCVESCCQLERAHITVTYRFDSNRRREVSNLQPTSKALVDGLVDAGLIPDDSDNHVIGPDNRRERPNGTPRVTITITPQETPNV